MKLFKNLKESMINLLCAVKSYYLFKSEHEEYLKNTSISVKEIEQFLDRLNIKKYDKNDLTYQALLTSSDNGYYIKLLRVNSLYNNHNLFKFLYKKSSLKQVLYDMRTVINNKTLNQRIKTINIEELKKNLQYVNNANINLLVLETALRLSDSVMYDLVENLLDFTNHKQDILDTMCFVISNYGKQIKEQPLSQKIKIYINKDNFYQYNHKSYMDEDYESLDFMFYPTKVFNENLANINSFLNINIIDIINKKSLSYDEINNLHLSERQIKSIIKSIDKNSSYEQLIVFYLNYYNYETAMYKKFYFLIKNNLINDKVWDTIYNDSLARTKIFNNYKILSQILPEEKLKIILIKHKENLSNYSLNLHAHSDFFKNYPYLLTESELKNFLIKSDSYCCYTNELDQMSFEIIKNKYLGQLNVNMYHLNENKQEFEKNLNQEYFVLDLLAKKYPYIYNEEFFLEVIKQSKNDLFLYCYLTRYFGNNNSEVLKLKIIQQLKTFNGICFFRNTLKWIIENNLLKYLFSEDIKDNQMFVECSNNYLVPVLIEKYKVKADIFIEKCFKSYIINKELFYFILHNYEVSEKTKQILCQEVYRHNNVELAEDCFKRGFTINDKTMEKINLNPNEAGHILMKSNLKNKMENKYNKNLQKQSVRKI